MPAVLHLLTRGDPERARAAIETQRADSETTLTIALLPGARAPMEWGGRRVPEELSYGDLLDLIFASDQVIAW
jgi:hypothetical protein